MRADDSNKRRGTPGEVFRVFLRLGLTSFGGPIAHLGYFRSELVLKRGWIDEAAFAELVALCQFLPGPASSQAGFVLGWKRGGPLGAIAAWIGFTLPSALIMLALGLGATQLDGPITAHAVHGLKLVAVVVVAQAVWGMARTLTPDTRRRAIAVAAVATVAVSASIWGQIAAIMIGAFAGWLLCRGWTGPDGAGISIGVPRSVAAGLLALFAALLLFLPPLAALTGWPEFKMLTLFYRVGALVFGGGHVVLPLLRAELVPTGWISDDRFLAGYGLAQALPGPLFAIAAYLGAASGGTLLAALAALIGIFAPGLLIVSGALPFWGAIRTSAVSRAIVAGVNAAVVGILAYALYDPLWTTSVASVADVALVSIGLVCLLRWRMQPILLVVALVAASFLLGVPG